MKSYGLALIVASVVAIGQLSAQEYAFKVLVNKGKNELKSGATWQQIKVGSSLQSHDELKIAENSYLGLVHVSGKPLELKQSGSYKVVDLALKVNSGSNVLNKYTDFILSTNTGPKNNLAATGAVDRGLGNIQVHLPQQAQHAAIYGNIVTVAWDEPEKSASPYIVTFNSMFGDELSRVETNDHHVIVNLNDKNFANEDNIIVKVVSKSDPSKESIDYTLKKLSKADKERFTSVLNEVSSETTEQNAMNKLFLAGVYEQKGLLIDATGFWIEAIKLAPDVQDFKDDYEAFLIRNHIKKPPVKK